MTNISSKLLNNLDRESVQAQLFLADLELFGFEEGYLFLHEGVPCVVYRHPFGHLNGYIRVEKVDYGIHYDEVTFAHDVHGGLTFSGHIGFVDSNLTGWWLGFDANHAQDWSLSYPMGIYRDLEYVKGELKSLAEAYANRDKVELEK